MTAIRALNADSPIIQTRLNRVVELALIDPDCYLTPNERELIASLVEVEAEQDTNRTKNLMIRLTEIEHQELQFLADEAGKTMSDYVRSKIF